MNSGLNNIFLCNIFANNNDNSYQTLVAVQLNKEGKNEIKRIGGLVCKDGKTVKCTKRKL